MPKSELEDIDTSTILGITDQQLNLLKTIYRISSKNKPATPREIEQTFTVEHPDGIHKTNLFRQMKILQDKGLIHREPDANYQINFDGLKKTLDERKQEQTQKLQHYEQLTNQIEEYFRRATRSQKEPVVEYLEYTELFERLTESIRKSTKYYITSKFPGIVYTYAPYSNIGRGEYAHILVQRCIEKKELEVIYLTPLDLDYPYTHSAQLFKDKEKTLRECEVIISQLESLSDTYKNLHVMHLENPYGLDVVIPEGKELSESYLFIRDERMNVTGGIYIKSSETAKRSKETFLNLCSNAHEVKGDYSKKICLELRNKLKDLGGSADGKTIHNRE